MCSKELVVCKWDDLKQNGAESITQRITETRARIYINIDTLSRI